MPSRESNESERSARALEIDHCLRLSGELTHATVRDFDKAIGAAFQASPQEIVIDLAGLDQIDEAGLTALLKAHLRSRRHGLPIKFVPEEHAAVKQVVAVTGTEENPD